MPDLLFFDFVIVTAIIAIGAGSQAAIGMGLNLFAIPLLLIVNPIFAPGPVLVASFALSFLALWRLPAKVDPRELKLMVLGLLLGTFLAALVAVIANGPSLTRTLGASVVFGVGLALSGWSAALSTRNLLLAGGAAGLLGTIAGVHAPPIALLYHRLPAQRVRGAILMFVGLGNALSIIALIAVGAFHTEQIFATLILLPGVLVGLGIAPALTRAIAVSTLRILVLSISGLSGLLLLLT